ncbi:FtsX-like permease family protein [Streptomyces sp. NPDC088261]|uniref:FtsX-like permease family protein n=1 Tax=Streptomyces sp. NPDC088261 TaxID=3365851 RepID=UPI0037F4117E
MTGRARDQRREKHREGHTGGRRERPVAPWVRTRLRTAPGTALVLGLLVVLTAFLAAAFPRTVDTYETRGLRDAVAEASPERRVLDFRSPERSFELPLSAREEKLRPGGVDAVQREVSGLLADPLRADTSQSARGVRTGRSLIGSDAWLPRHDGLPPQFALAAQAGLAAHSTVRHGQLPTADGRVTATTRTVEAAVSSATATTLRLSVGSMVHVGRAGSPTLTVRISGIVDPVRPSGSYWTSDSLLRTPHLSTTGAKPPQFYWEAALLLAPEAAPALLGTAGEPERYWRVAPDTSRLTGPQVGALSERIASLQDGPALSRLRSAAGTNASLDTDLDDILHGYASLRSAITPVVAVAAVGIGTVAVVVLALAGGLSARRRHTELVLVRARGGSLRGIGGRLLAETAVVTLPAAALGLLVAVLLVPGGRTGPAVLAATAVAVVACAALPLRAVLAHRTPQVYGERDDLVRGRPSRRRTVAELTLLVLAVGAVTALRQRGTTDSGDHLVSAAPVLIGLITATLLVRLYPLPLRLAARPAKRLRGAVGFLSLARAGRAPATGTLTLLVLVVALSTAAFGQAVLAGTADARDRAALLAVRADARISSPNDTLVVPAGTERAVRDVPGVRSVVAVRAEHQVNVGTRAGSSSPVHATLVGVDPEPYAGLARDTDLGGFPAGVLGTDTPPGASGGGVLPVVASPGVADALGRTPRRITTLVGVVTVRVVAVRSRTPATASSEFLLVDRAGLPQRAATTLLVSGGGPDGTALDGKALRAAVRASGAEHSVHLRGEIRARLVDSPLQTGAKLIYHASILAGGGYIVVALLLSLVHTTPERVSLLALLRTLGLTSRQGRRLLALEALPQAVLAAAGGALAGWATILLIAPGVDVTRLALAAAPGLATGLTAAGGAALRPEPWSLTLSALAVVVLTGTVTAAQARWAARRGSADRLRTGDAR